MRMSGTLRLLGALWVNLDLEGAWCFVAAMLNAVPPNRPSASALLAFLQTAGNALCGQYGRQVCTHTRTAQLAEMLSCFLVLNRFKYSTDWH